MSSEDGWGSGMDPLSHNWKSALVVNSLHDALEEAERQRDEMAQMLSNQQHAPSLFEDEWAQGSSEQINNSAPPHISHKRDYLDDTKGEDCCSPSSILQRQGRGRTGFHHQAHPPPFLRRSLLVGPSQTTAISTEEKSPGQCESSGTLPDARVDRAILHSTDDAKEEACELGFSVDPVAHGDDMLPTPRGSSVSAGRAGDPNNERYGIRLGRPGRWVEEPLTPSGFPVGSVASELRTGELERVRGRVAHLGAAIETSQSKLLEELSQVREDFFSSFRYTPSLDAASTDGTLAKGRTDGTSTLVSSGFLASLPRADEGINSSNRFLRHDHRSFLKHSRRASAMSAGGDDVGGSRTASIGGAVAARARRRRGRGDRFNHLALSAGAEIFPKRGAGDTHAFSASRRSSPGRATTGAGEERRCRSASPSARSRSRWLTGNAPRHSSVEAAGPDELRARLLSELVQKEALTQDLQVARREAEEHLEGRSDAMKEVTLLKDACRSAEERATALERSARESREALDKKETSLKEATKAMEASTGKRDRLEKKYGAFRRASAERTVSLWTQQRNEAALRAATSRWRKETLESKRVKDLAKRLLHSRACRALAKWRSEAWISAIVGKDILTFGFRQSGRRAMTSTLRRRGVRCLRQWALWNRRRKCLRKLLKTYVVTQLRGGWSRFRATALALTAEVWQARLQEVETLFRQARARADSLECQLEQSQVLSVKTSDRIAALRSKSLRMAALRRNARAVFSAWANYSRRRSRARVLLWRVLDRWRKRRLAQGFCTISAEAHRDLVLNRLFIRFRLAKVSKTKALWWSHLVQGVAHSREQRQALSKILVRRPVYAAFSRLKQHALYRQAIRHALSRVSRLTKRRILEIQRDALRRWAAQSVARSSAIAALSRVLRHRDARRVTTALAHWRRAMADTRASVAGARAEFLSREIAQWKRRGKLASMRTFVRVVGLSQHRTLVWGFQRLAEASSANRLKVRAARKFFQIVQSHKLSIVSGALARWKRLADSHSLEVIRARRLARVVRSCLLRRAVRRWSSSMERQHAAEALVCSMEKASRRVLLTRGLRRWNGFCVCVEAKAASYRTKRDRSAMSDSLAKVSRRAVLLRCLMEWRTHTITRRWQLRLARTFLLGRNRRILRSALAAWRDGWQSRARVARALARLVHAYRMMVLRTGLRRLEDWSHWRERHNKVQLLASARFETERALQERDGLSARLLEAAMEGKQAEEKRREEQRLFLAQKVLVAWRGIAELGHRKRAGACHLVRRFRRGFLRQAFWLWRDGANGVAALALTERIVAHASKRELLRKKFRAWANYSSRRHREANALSRVARKLRDGFGRVMRDRLHEAFRGWKVLAVARTRRMKDISSACSRLQAVRLRTGRLEMATTFHFWARISAEASGAKRSVRATLVAKRHRILRTTLYALSMHASSRRLARRALSAVEQSARLRRLARGWSAIAAAAAAAGASRGNEARLETAEGRVVTVSAAARVRAHRTARRLLGVARGRTALEAFVAWRGLVREKRGARLGAAALCARSTRRCLRETFAVWRKNALASSELRSRAVARLSFSALGLVRGAFCRWRDASRISRAKEKATSMIARLSSGRHSNRAKLRLALRTWRWATFRGSWGENLVDSGGDGNRSPGGKWKQHLSVEVLGLLSELAQDAASSFSLASSVARVFALVEAFTPRAARVSQGRLLLFSGEPGRELYCLESDPLAPSRAPVDFSFAAGTGLVGHCVSTCLPCQLEHPPAYPPYASPLSSSGVRHEAMHVTDGGGSVGTREMGLGKAVDLVGPADFYGILVGEGTPLASPGGEAGVESRAFVRRSRLAYFPPNIDDDRDESPSHPSSPLRDSLRAPAKARGQGHRGRSQSPSRSLIRHRAGPRAREGASGAVQRVNVVCVPVCGGSSADGDIGCGRVMMGVLKAWRRPGAGRDDVPMAVDYYTPAEITALAMLAGQAAAALVRLDAEAAAKESNTDEREAAVRDEVKRLREAMEELSGSAQGLARQRDDARASLARAKAVLRRMAPALREVRDRQLGFRHYHDLIVSMSRNVLQEDAGTAGREEHKHGGPEIGSGQAWSLGLSFGGGSSGSHAVSSGSLGSVLGRGAYVSHEGRRADHAFGGTATSRFRTVEGGAAQSGGHSPLETARETDTGGLRSSRRSIADGYRYSDNTDVIERSRRYGGGGGSHEGYLFASPPRRRDRLEHTHALVKSDDRIVRRDDARLLASSSIERSVRTSGVASSFESSGGGGSGSGIGGARRGAARATPRPGGRSPLSSPRQRIPQSHQGTRNGDDGAVGGNGSRRPPNSLAGPARGSYRGVRIRDSGATREDHRPEILRALRETAAGSDRGSASTRGKSGASEAKRSRDHGESAGTADQGSTARKDYAQERSRQNVEAPLDRGK